MKKLFLASDAGRVIHLIQPLFSKPFSEIRLAVIPTAANLETHKPWYDDEISSFKQAGFTLVDVDIQGKKEAEIRKVLKDMDGVFVTGGNTYHLLYHARASGFDRVIKDLVNNGIVYIGSSAGSLLAGKNIDMARRMDNPEAAPITDFTGLGLVDYCILPHIDNPQYIDMVEPTLADWQDKSVRLIGLKDTQAMMIRGNYTEIVDIEA